MVKKTVFAQRSIVFKVAIIPAIILFLNFHGRIAHGDSEVIERIDQKTGKTIKISASQIIIFDPKTQQKEIFNLDNLDNKQEALRNAGVGQEELDAAIDRYHANQDRIKKENERLAKTHAPNQGATDYLNSGVQFGVAAAGKLYGAGESAVKFVLSPFGYDSKPEVVSPSPGTNIEEARKKDEERRVKDIKLAAQPSRASASVMALMGAKSDRVSEQQKLLEQTAAIDPENPPQGFTKAEAAKVVEWRKLVIEGVDKHAEDEDAERDSSQADSRKAVIPKIARDAQVRYETEIRTANEAEEAAAEKIRLQKEEEARLAKEKRLENERREYYYRDKEENEKQLSQYSKSDQEVVNEYLKSLAEHPKQALGGIAHGYNKLTREQKALAVKEIERRANEGSTEEKKAVQSPSVRKLLSEVVVKPDGKYAQTGIETAKLKAELEKFNQGREHKYSLTDYLRLSKGLEDRAKAVSEKLDEPVRKAARAQLDRDLEKARELEKKFGKGSPELEAHLDKVEGRVYAKDSDGLSDPAVVAEFEKFQSDLEVTTKAAEEKAAADKARLAADAAEEARVAAQAEKDKKTHQETLKVMAEQSDNLVLDGTKSVMDEKAKDAIRAKALLGQFGDEARKHEEEKFTDPKALAEMRDRARKGDFGPEVVTLAKEFDAKVASGEIKLDGASEPKVADAKTSQSGRVPEKVDESVTKVAQALKEKREALGKLRVQKAAEADIKKAENEALALEQQLTSMKTKENRREVANLILDGKAAERKIIMASGEPAPKQSDPRAKAQTGAKDKGDAAYQKYKAHFQRLREQESLPNEQEAGYMGGIVHEELNAEKKKIAKDPVLKAAFEKAEGEYQAEKKKKEESAAKTAEAEKKRAAAEEKVANLKKLKEAAEKRKKLRAEGAEYWEEGQQNQEIRRLERKANNVSAEDADSALTTASKELAELGGAKATAGKVDVPGSSTSVSQTPGTTAPAPPAPPAAPELSPKEKAAKALAEAKAERERVAKEYEEKRTKAIGEQKEKVASASKRDEDRIKNLQGDGKKKFNQVDAVPVSTCKRDDAGNEVGGSYQYTNLRIFMDSEIKSREAMDFRECINQHVLHAATTADPAELKKNACDATATQESKLPPKVLATREYGRRLFQYVKGIRIVKSANASAVAAPVLDDRGVLVIEVDDSGEKSGQNAFKKGDAKGKEVIEYSMKAQKSKSDEDKMGYKKASICQKLEGEKGLFAMLDNYGNRALAAAPKQEEEKLMAGALKDLAEAKKSAEATERAAEASWSALQADGASSPKSTVVASGGPGAADPNAGNATK